jgi:hypothetical protein
VSRVPQEHNSVQAFGWSKTWNAINNIAERDGSDDVANQWPHKQKSEATIATGV